MPAILRKGPYRFYFYSNEKGEPPHIHVQTQRSPAKFWVQPVVLASSKRFPSHELRAIRNMAEDHQNELLEAWDKHAGN